MCFLTTTSPAQRMFSEIAIGLLQAGGSDHEAQVGLQGESRGEETPHFYGKRYSRNISGNPWGSCSKCFSDALAGRTRARSCALRFGSVPGVTESLRLFLHVLTAHLESPFFCPKAS